MERGFSLQMTYQLIPDAGVAELIIFHPVDTVAKRLMSNKSKVPSCYVCAVLSTYGKAIGVIYITVTNHLPRCSCSSLGPQTSVIVPWSWLRRWLQDHATRI